MGIVIRGIRSVVEGSGSRLAASLDENLGSCGFASNGTQWVRPAKSSEIVRHSQDVLFEAPRWHLRGRLVSARALET